MPDQTEPDEHGCRKPSKFFPVTTDFLMFVSRWQKAGFDRDDIHKLTIMLAERFLREDAETKAMKERATNG